MEAEASNLLENVPNIQASGVDTQGGRGSALDRVINGPYGAVFTGLYKKFHQLYYDDKQNIFYERKLLNTPTKIRSKRRNTSATKSE